MKRTIVMDGQLRTEWMKASMGIGPGSAWAVYAPKQLARAQLEAIGMELSEPKEQSMGTSQEIEQAYCEKTGSWD